MINFLILLIYNNNNNNNLLQYFKLKQCSCIMTINLSEGIMLTKTKTIKPTSCFSFSIDLPQTNHTTASVRNMWTIQMFLTHNGSHFQHNWKQMYQFKIPQDYSLQFSLAKDTINTVHEVDGVFVSLALYPLATHKSSTTYSTKYSFRGSITVALHVLALCLQVAGDLSCLFSIYRTVIHEFFVHRLISCA